MGKDVKMLKSRMKDLVSLSNRLPDDGMFGFFKVISTYYLIEYSEKYIFLKKRNPIPEMIRLINIFKSVFEQLIILDRYGDHSYKKDIKKDISSMDRGKIENMTQQVYGDLWKDFSMEKFYNEAFKNLSDRLKRNNIEISWFKHKTCLDAGCGGGRYSVALSRLGAGKVIGIDMTEKGLLNARRRVKALRIKNIYFRKGNVLNIPFQKESFDFVLSNGVLHHTVNTERGVKEISRVLKKRGKIFIYLEGKGGLYYELFYLGRELLRNIPKEQSISALKTIGLSGNRVFYFIDPLYVLLQNWTTPKEVESLLKKYNFTNITRLYRGADYDRNECLFNPQKMTKYSYLIHGFGELRYMAEKK